MGFPTKHAQDPKTSETTPFLISLFCITVRTPEDNLPILEDWVTNAVDIYAQGFEAHREVVEVKLIQELQLGDELKPGCMVPNKGFGRVAALWFGVLWTFKNMTEISGDQLNDFVRLVDIIVKGSKGSPLNTSSLRS